MAKTKITQLELILTHSPRKNAPSQDELFSTFYFKRVLFSGLTDVTISTQRTEYISKSK